MSDNQERQVESEIAGPDHDPAAFAEPSRPRSDQGEDDPGLSSTVPADTDIDQLRDGGPQLTPAVATTTGGTAGPNSFTTPPRSGPGVANTTTGDATTGAMETSTDGSTSDASTNAVE